MASRGESVGIDKSFDDGIIVTALEVIPSGVAGIAVSFSCYLDSKSAEKVASFSVLSIAGFLAGTTIQGFISYMI